jgi:hypothetical protein
MLGNILGLTVLGLWHNAYRENWPQRVGLVALAIWCAVEMYHVGHGRNVCPQDWVLYTGMFTYAFGTALKVLRFRKENTPRAVGSTYGTSRPTTPR